MEYIKEFPLKNIVISEDFRNTKPAAWKIQRKAEYYEKTGKLPADIAINDEGVLIDGYITYLLAVSHGFTHVPVKRGYVELIQAAHHAGTKAYLWRVPPKFQGMIHKGDKCIVRSGSGVKRVIVQNIIRQQYPVQIPRLRNVVRLLQCDIGNSDKGQLLRNGLVYEG